MLDRSKATVQAEPRIPKPETLEAKFKLMTVLPFDARIRRRHMVVFGFVVDWFHSKYGNALASVRHVAEMLKERDPSGAGLSTSYIHNSLSELVAWGYLRCEAGIGKRASRYVPNWDLVCTVRSVHPVVDATRPYVREVKVARPRSKLNTGLLWIGQSLAPSLARANHERG